MSIQIDQGCRVGRKYPVIGCNYPSVLCDPDPGELGRECLVCQRVNK